MHTVLVILGGLGLMMLIYSIAHWRGNTLRRAFPVFAMLWAAAALTNMWIGVARAGYAVTEELPIFLVVFGVPCVVAWLLARRSA